MVFCSFIRIFASSNPTINNYKTMKRTILLFLSVMMTVIMTAGDVTPQQALQQAQKFLQQTPSGMKRSQAEVPQLKMVGRVSGLYVFNAEQNQGYVIVSNDDRTVPILGYSETGTLDPDNMPCNMRAWLQGYADEIAWLNEHNIQPITSQPSRRTSAVKEPIAPLVKTHWDQGSPYNDNCPYYKYDEGSYSYKVTITDETGYEHCATGCVATAMAQVMYYNQWPTAATAAIPSYSWQGYTIGGLPATTFDWTNMQLNYTGSETLEQNAAVAKLMQYCGAAVKMDYGYESSAYLNIIADVLKNYFGYNATTQTAARSVYSYAEWIEIVYHELKQGRPVLYGGQSSGGGHEFVCDGYQGEDFFHINWGWSGISDNYFKLSALDPDQQGIGGSTSTDGYYYGQVAVIGLQKPSDEGTVLDIEPHNINLTCSSISCVDGAAVGEEVDITLNVINNTDQDFSGDIYVGIKYDESSFGLLAGSLFEISAWGTKNCTVKATFNNEGTYNLVFFFPNQYGNYFTDGQVRKTITITAGGGGLPTSDDIDLTVSVKSIENANAGLTEVYGTANDKDINAVITITNPSATANYYGTYIVYMRSVDYPDYYYYNWRYIWIPAGGSYDFKYTASDMYLPLDYQLSTLYQKAGAFTSETNIGSAFSFLPGIFAYQADGTKSAVKATSSYSVPANAVAVDMSGAGVTTVTKNSNPNTLYILKKSDSVPGGLDNVVTLNNDGSYSSKKITLTDGNDFYSPIDFTAKDIEFTYANDRWADGANGWNTIMLPFDVTSVTANGTDIDWFHSGSETNKQFWLKKFVSDDPGVVNFDFTNEMKANTPYIIALPGNHWSSDYDLSGKTIKFIGQDVTIHKNGELSSVTGSNYRFIGTTVTDATSDIYIINDAGNQFVLDDGCAPFRAYFKSGTYDSTVSSLSIGNGGGTTGIETMSDVRSVMSDVWYDLQGRRVENPTKGVYIKNGRKVVIK